MRAVVFLLLVVNNFQTTPNKYIYLHNALRYLKRFPKQFKPQEATVVVF
jgi:hypothetical protein